MGFRLMSGAVLRAIALRLRSPLQTAGRRREAAAHRGDAAEGTP